MYSQQDLSSPPLYSHPSIAHHTSTGGAGCQASNMRGMAREGCRLCRTVKNHPAPLPWNVVSQVFGTNHPAPGTPRPLYASAELVGGSMQPAPLWLRGHS